MYGGTTDRHAARTRAQPSLQRSAAQAGGRADGRHGADPARPGRGAIAREYLMARGQADWIAEIERMIADHHKITPSTAIPGSLVEPFRRADWIDVTRGLRRRLPCVPRITASVIALHEVGCRGSRGPSNRTTPLECELCLLETDFATECAQCIHIGNTMHQVPSDPQATSGVHGR